MACNVIVAEKGDMGYCSCLVKVLFFCFLQSVFLSILVFAHFGLGFLFWVCLSVNLCKSIFYKIRRVCFCSFLAHILLVCAFRLGVVRGKVVCLFCADCYLWVGGFCC